MATLFSGYYSSIGDRFIQVLQKATSATPSSEFRRSDVGMNETITTQMTSYQSQKRANCLSSTYSVLWTLHDMKDASASGLPEWKIIHLLLATSSPPLTRRFWSHLRLFHDHVVRTNTRVGKSISRPLDGIAHLQDATHIQYGGGRLLSASLQIMGLLNNSNSTHFKAPSRIWRH